MSGINLCPAHMSEVVTIKLGLETGSLLSGWDDYWAYFGYKRGVGAVHK